MARRSRHDAQCRLAHLAPRPSLSARIVTAAARKHGTHERLVAPPPVRSPPKTSNGQNERPRNPRPSYHSPHVAEAFQLGPSRGARRQIRRQVRRRCADHRHLLPAVVRRPAAARAQRAHVQDGRRGARGRTSALQALPARSFLSRRRQRHRIVRRARRARAHRARACPRRGGARARLRREPNQAQRPHARAGTHDPGGVAQARARAFGLPGAPAHGRARGRRGLLGRLRKRIGVSPAIPRGDPDDARRVSRLERRVRVSAAVAGRATAPEKSSRITRAIPRARASASTGQRSSRLL